MAASVLAWLEQNPNESFEFKSGQQTTFTAKQLREHIKEKLPAIRLIALTHDLTHAAFGHTLEDEICVFEQRHDDPKRQAKFFDALTAQLVWIWAIELGFPSALGEVEFVEEISKTDRLEVDESKVLERIKWIGEHLSIYTSESEVTGKKPSQALEKHLKHLEWAFTALLYLESLHEKGDIGPEPPLLITRVLETLISDYPGPNFLLQRDAFALDMIGNTICADLLDYAQRDSHFSGLKTAYDDRLIRYMAIVSVINKTDVQLCPTDGERYLRLAIQYHTNKVRLDVISELTQVLRTRYQITESVLLHPTKCAAGAMLGRVIQLLGIGQFPDCLLVLGDAEIMRVLEETAKILEALCQAVPQMSSQDSDSTLANVMERFAPYDEAQRELIELCVRGILPECDSLVVLAANLQKIRSRAAGARRVLWNLRARRFPQPVFRIRYGIRISDTVSSDSLALKFSSKEAREEVERELEERCDLPIGSVFIHCPRAKTGMKLAQVMLFGPDKNEVRYLRDLASLGNKQELDPYQDAVKATEDMYKSIWKFHIFLDRAHMDKALLVAHQAELIVAFGNDASLQTELEQSSSKDNPYDLMCKDFQEDYAPRYFAPIVRELGQKVKSRARSRGEFDGVQPITAAQLVKDAIEKVQRTNISTSQHTVSVEELDGQRASASPDSLDGQLDFTGS